MYNHNERKTRNTLNNIHPIHQTASSPDNGFSPFRPPPLMAFAPPAPPAPEFPAPVELDPDPTAVLAALVVVEVTVGVAKVFFEPSKLKQAVGKVKVVPASIV
jgi:hypothetical protein